uniref:helix-turn-helix domain-containing protein n=1 Tax=Saccharomonospora halophila TaxID=129922 RepID=UPI00037285D9
DGASTGEAREWALARLDRPLSLDEWAARAAMSVRTFTRRFRQETGLSPGRWLTAQRVERARQLLERTDLPIERIAVAVGFGTTVSLRQHLRATLGVSPSVYRGTFRGPARPESTERPQRCPTGTPTR